MITHHASGNKMAGALELPDTEIIQYLCACGKWRSIYRLYLCRHCYKIRCGDCVLHEVLSRLPFPII